MENSPLTDLNQARHHYQKRQKTPASKKANHAKRQNVELNMSLKSPTQVTQDHELASDPNALNYHKLTTTISSRFSHP
jgi:hypothetical protein